MSSGKIKFIRRDNGGVHISSKFNDLYFVGNKAKGRISKRVFQESKARQNFRKTNISYLLIRTRTFFWPMLGE